MGEGRALGCGDRLGDQRIEGVAGGKAGLDPGALDRLKGFGHRRSLTHAAGDQCATGQRQARDRPGGQGLGVGRPAGEQQPVLCRVEPAAIGQRAWG